jgi:aspartate racemase
MKTIGLIGGMSWESTKEYYQIMNEAVRDRLGGLHSVKCVLYSFDFAEIEVLQHTGEWETLAKMMIEAATALEKAGADFIVICANTMHKVAENIQAKTRLPILHIADTTSQRILGKNIRRVGLLGTKFTMEEDFYRKRLEKKWNIQVIVPRDNEQKTIHDIIYGELCLGVINQSSKERIKKVIKNLIARGAEGIVLGCTEIPLLIKQNDVEVPVFDTTEIHAKAAVDFALDIRRFNS